jgi:hypothetical protein
MNEPASPALRASWFLRVTAIVSVFATGLGIMILPGVRGLAPDRVVATTGRLTSTFAYFMCGLVIAACVRACFELSRAMRMSIAARVVAIGGAVGVLAFAAPALLVHLPMPVAMAMSLSAVTATLAAGWATLRVSRTRAVGVIVVAFGSAALLRLAAWEISLIAGDRANVSLYALSRGVATGGVVLEGVGQMIAAAWLGTRSRFGGQALSSLAVAVAFVLTWGAVRGASSSAEDWQAGLHTALSGAPGTPPPFGLGALATFLVPAAMLLGLVAAVQTRQVTAIVCALALALIGRGAFDVPLRALAATAAALWLMVSLVDDRAMWQSLLEQHEREQDTEPKARAKACP